ncbi:ABC transporter permease [Mammaliicoccus stepanovicii]|uniref:ABC-2 transporter family protein n=1 Tax=Mammaliicoccus stepanovicii TaxID=643214 RepID=A0A239YS47_9STAP|nr:ABC transporter permease subunit [Mammaliicoccus stepanovicii]PNZ73232.1 ABC transporter permease [Mammaliicoccus stepanovicii]GGI42421.1 ABC transporter permease [Mammaliicoccus stepanovicii]SNV61216.1 ABC-2 transporter family protein [Mammaliicoccus stepanovicii]
MNILQHVKFDLTRIFRSPLSYLGFLISILPGLGMIIAVKTLDAPFEAPVILSMFLAFGGLVLLMFCLRTIVRDMQYGTIQLFLNSKLNRTKYLSSKLLSVIAITILFTIIGTVFTLISTLFVETGELAFTDFLKMFGELLLITLFYVTLMNILSIATGKSAIVYTIAILCVTFLPTIFDAVAFIPKFGEQLSEIMRYTPLAFLPQILNQGLLEMKPSQIWITIGCIIIFVVINNILIRNKNI